MAYVKNVKEKIWEIPSTPSYIHFSSNMCFYNINIMLQKTLCRPRRLINDNVGITPEASNFIEKGRVRIFLRICIFYRTLPVAPSVFSILGVSSANSSLSNQYGYCCLSKR